MRFWQALSFTETDQIVPLARTAEESGFDGIMISDHVFVPGQCKSAYPYSPDGKPPFTTASPHPEPWAAICAMGQVAPRLWFTTGVYLPCLRHPLHVAKSLATASVLTNGRVALGVGVGWMREEFEVLGKDFGNRGPRMDEELEIMRKLWAGGLVEHHGRHYDFPALATEPRPVAPIPIWIGGQSSPALRRAVRYDGWLSSGETPESAIAVLARLRALREQAGVLGRPFEVTIAVAGPPDLGLYHRLEELGATGLIAYPPVYTTGPGQPVDARRRVIEEWARSVIRRY